jgi:hypothetical protein
LKYARASLSKLVDGNNDDAKLLLYHLFGIESSAKLTVPAASALIDWAGSTAANDWQPDPASVQEAARLITAANVEAGQMTLVDEPEKPRGPLDNTMYDESDADGAFASMH